MGAYRINIVGLTNRIHDFHYEIGEDFFREYGTDLVSSGKFVVDVALDKRETFLEANIHIVGTADLVCDRSLEPFEHQIDSTHKVVFKYGDRDEEITDEIMIINRDTAWLELGHFLYEFIALAIPLKRLHPRFQDELEEDDDGTTGKIVYTSGDPDSGNDKDDEKDNGDDIDPRWNILKKLK